VSTPTRIPVLSSALVLALALALSLSLAAAPAQARGPELTDADKRELDKNWKLVLTKNKGPYSSNYCVCKNGEKQPVMLPDGRIQSPCNGNPNFCAAFREPWADAIGGQGMYVANLFARDLYLWDTFPDHHDLVRGFVLEKFFMDTHPDHKLSQMRAYGGLAGAEYEARDQPRFVEKFLDLPSFKEPRDYLLAYELQRRFFVRADQGQIARARNLASSIQNRRKDFKPLRDQVHNQISATQIPKVQAYCDKLSAGPALDDCNALVTEIGRLTSLDEGALTEQIQEIQDPALREQMAGLLPAADAGSLEKVDALANLMVKARQDVEAKRGSAADRRRLVDLAITAGAVVQQRSMDVLEKGGLTGAQQVGLLQSLTNASFGSGLLMERERRSAVKNFQEILAEGDPTRAELEARLDEAGRVAEWSQLTVNYAFEEVRLPWTYLLPSSFHIADDVLRGSPMLPYAKALAQMEEFAAGAAPVRHDLFGEAVERDVRALNPGLAVGVLKVAPETGEYSREEVLALPETPAELEPAAGIVTRGEGNVVSHVQLLARALGIPNAVVGGGPYQKFVPHDGQEVFYIATPGGRVIMKTVASLTDQDRTVIAEYTKNQGREGDGDVASGGSGGKLVIDVERLDVENADVLDLADMRITDSGVRVGPKAAFLGQLKHSFPDKVARGIVVPFGAYYAHFKAAPVAVPPSLAGKGIATPGGKLDAFVEQTYATFFDELIATGKSERELTAWIRPRLEVIRYSIESHPIDAGLKAQIKDQLADLGLLESGNPSQTVGLFIRSDTNVEDLENFNGAGLNLTLFNRRSLASVYEGLKDVWASPFTYRSFSWRQTLIDEPLWVLPSVVILESIPSEKSGVLVTAGMDGADRSRMLIATSEGVGGAVDGTPAETVVWSKNGVELVTMFKSPYRRLLKDDGGSHIVPSTGGEVVLSRADIDALTRAALKIEKDFPPSEDPNGKPRPWDVEFGFAGGKLWLFQTRPFIGNESLANVPALAAYEAPRDGMDERVSLDGVVK
jgi:hypothetical protein